MTRSLGIVFALALSAPVQGPREVAPHPRPVPTLRVGDPAPPLKVSNWLRGTPVNAFEPGRVYVVEFWATWCGPCIAAMPHLAELQAEYRGRGVTVIGFTSRDLPGNPQNSEREVADFLTRRGGRFDYTFAYADDGVTAGAWMTAAGWANIPCTFVVDRAGRIAYVGHPMYLPAVLPRVVSGRTPATEVAAEVAQIESEFRAFTGRELFDDPAAGLLKLKAFEARHPELADFMSSVRIKLSLLPAHGKPGEAREYAESLVARSIDRKNVQILGMASAMLRGDGKADPDLLAIAVRASEAEVRIDGGHDPRSLIDLADAYFQAGDKAKSRDHARRAKQAATGAPPGLREYVEKELARMGGD